MFFALYMDYVTYSSQQPYLDFCLLFLHLFLLLGTVGASFLWLLEKYAILTQLQNIVFTQKPVNLKVYELFKYREHVLNTLVSPKYLPEYYMKYK